MRSGHWLLLAAITVVALGVRFWRLDSGLWVDEVFTLTDFVRVPLGQIVTSFPSQNQHMFYSVLAHASVITFGESAWSLRLPALLFGALTIWPVFLLALIFLVFEIILLIASRETEHHGIGGAKDGVFFILYGILLLIANPGVAA